MKLQELVNKLSNMLASGAGEAEVKFNDVGIQKAILVKDGDLRTVVIT